MFFLFLVVALAYVASVYIRRQYSYWQRHMFPYDTNSKIPFGCLKSVVKREKSMGMAVYDVYRKTKEDFIGCYLLFRPALLVRDVELVRRMMQQDFGSFHDRGTYVDEENNPLSANLFSQKGKSWKTMRTKLAPSFSSGKLKSMFSTTEDIGNKMVKHLNNLLPESGSAEVDLKDICTTYAIDIIASVIFGLDINSFENPQNQFQKIVATSRRKDFFFTILGMVIFLCPPIAKLLAKLGIKNPVAVQLRDVIKDTIEYREKHNIVRKDLLQLMMQLRNTGKIDEDDNNWNVQSSTPGQTKSLSIDAITAQAFIFYIAGQETTSSAAAFTMFELAQYPELLKRAQQEVAETLEKNGGQITYEALQEMKFLDLCLQETLRKYPFPMLNRECTQDYIIPGTNKVIEKGTPIVISLYGIHHDPENFPEPEKYDPERYSSSNCNLNAFMPFGEGPRHCIAQRMGKVNAKLAVVKLLQNFNIEILEKRELEIDNFSVALMPKGGIPIKLSKKRNN